MSGCVPVCICAAVTSACVFVFCAPSCASRPNRFSMGSVSGSSPGGSRSTTGQSRSGTSRGGWESEIEIDMLQVTHFLADRLNVALCAHSGAHFLPGPLQTCNRTRLGLGLGLGLAETTASMVWCFRLTFHLAYITKGGRKQTRAYLIAHVRSRLPSPVLLPIILPRA